MRTAERLSEPEVALGVGGSGGVVGGASSGPELEPARGGALAANAPHTVEDAAG